MDAWHRPEGGHAPLIEKALLLLEFVWSPSIMRGSKQVIVQVVLFQSRGHGHPKNDATPNFIHYFKSLLRLSIMVSFVS